jgi:DNA-binding XRE family transcriptional regulator
MGTRFDDYIREVEEKAKAGGPDAVTRWEAFNAHYTMAREVRGLRMAHKLTQKQLAAASGIHQGEISRIERGQTNPTAYTLAALLAPLGAHLGVVRDDQRDLARV